MKKLFYNQILDKKGTKKILSWFLENYGPTRTSQFIEQLKSVGFHFATEAGLSLGFDDLKVPSKKTILLNTAESDVLECEKRFFQGKITAVERYQKLIDIWTTASENLKDEVIQNFQNTDLLNPLYMMAFSGARGNISQVRQLVGMRGLMSDSAGGIIDFPIRSNFREGLTVTEYAISCYGARKGLIDTALRTADSGYLTRRLVDVAHGIMIGRLECATKESFEISPLKASGKSGSEAILLSLEKRIVGRVLAEKVTSTELVSLPVSQSNTFSSGKARSGLFSTTSAKQVGSGLAQSTIGYENEEISPSLAHKIVQYKKETVRVRSPLTCLHFQNLREDICQLCYGWSLAHGRLVSIGEAVGILAAQSIGEPGTQLTMRTFHTGGIFSTDIDAKIFAPHDGVVSFSMRGRGRKVRTFHGETAFFTFEPLQLKIVASVVPSASVNRRSDYGRNREVVEIGRSLSRLSETGSTSLETKAAPRSGKSSESFSIFRLPAHSLIFVYPGQLVSKNILCAEVSQLMSAKKSSRNISENIVTSSNSDKTKGIKQFSSSNSLENIQKSGLVSTEVSQVKIIASVQAGEIGLEEENDLSEESNKPNSKRVLSEMEGQIYFHRLAERRQITEFEKLSHVKGVGSLWVLAGKGVLINGPFQSGDFITKRRREAKIFACRPSDSVGSAASKTQSVNERLPSASFGEIKSIQYYRMDFAKSFLAIQTIPLANGILKSSHLLSGRKSTSPEDSFTRSPLGFDEVESSRGDRNYVAIEPLGKEFHSQWLIKQFLKAFPTLTVCTFSQKSLFKNRLRISKKLNFKTSRNDYNREFINAGLSLYTDGLLNQNGRLEQVKASKKLGFDKKACPGANIRTLTQIFGYSFYCRQENTSTRLKQFSILSSGYFRNISQNAPENHSKQLRPASSEIRKDGSESSFVFMGTLNPYSESVIAKNSNINNPCLAGVVEPGPGDDLFLLDQLELLQVRSQGKLQSRLGSDRAWGPFLTASSEGKDPMRRFEHGELRFLQDLNKKKLLDSKAERVSEHTNKKSVSFATQSLNLRTTDIRLYKKSNDSSAETTLVKHDLLRSSLSSEAGRKRTSHQAKIGELIRFGDAIDKTVGIDKTTQIIRRTAYFDDQAIFYSLRRVHPYLISNHSPLAVSHGDIVEARQFLFELFYQQSKTGDIVQGLPKIEQLFEARRTSIHVIETIHLRLKDKFQELCNEYPLYEAARLSIRFIQRILIDEIQLVYQSQGVDIADKHIEIIIRQMTSKVIIHEKGKSPFFPDDIIDFHQIVAWESLPSSESQKNFSPYMNTINIDSVSSSGIVFEPIVLGLTKIAFLTQSFVSAASFQETKRVLMNSALQSRVDFLYGLKENVIVGRFIRAGTGFRTSLFPSA
jgi:hypothetical protein